MYGFQPQMPYMNPYDMQGFQQNPQYMMGGMNQMIPPPDTGNNFQMMQ
jgi:hypothetical protein